MRIEGAMAALLMAGDPLCTSRDPAFDGGQGGTGAGTSEPASSTDAGGGDTSSIDGGSSSGGAGDGMGGLECVSAEPNSSRELAFDLGEHFTTEPSLSVAAGLGPGEEDWFTLHGQVVESDTNVQIAADLVTLQPDVEICVFVLCDEPPNESLECPQDDHEPAVFEELDGCCGVEQVGVRHSCRSSPGAIRDHARVWYRIRAPQAQACFDYTLWYGF